MDLSLSAVQKRLQSFRGTLWFDIVILVVLGLVVSGLFPITFGGFLTACLGLLLIPVATFVLPYWLGERRMKRFALNGLIVLLIAVIIVSLFYMNSTMSSGDQIVGSSGIQGVSPYIALDNGSVVPFRGPAGQNYTFRVHLTRTGLNVSAPVTVYLNFTEYNLFTPIPSQIPMNRIGPANTTSAWYATNKTLGGNVYEFWFTAMDNRSNFTITQNVIGPITAPAVSYFIFWVYPVAFYLVIPFSFYYIILFMYWYTLRTRKMRTRMIEAARGDELDLDKGPEKGSAKGGGTEETTATTRILPSREKTKKATAFTCTNCGADVTEDETKCPKCGAVFED